MNDLVDLTLKAWRRSSFEWGQRDCVLSVGDYLIAAGLPDAFSRWRGTYSTEAKARALLAAYGGAQGFIDLFGLPRIDPESAGRGDVVVIDPRDGVERWGIGGLCTGDGIALRTEKRAMIEISRRFVTVKFAWSVRNVGIG